MLSSSRTVNQCWLYIKKIHKIYNMHKETDYHIVFELNRETIRDSHLY